MLVLSEGPLFVLRPQQPQCQDGGKGDGPVASRPIRVQPTASIGPSLLVRFIKLVIDLAKSGWV